MKSAMRFQLSSKAGAVVSKQGSRMIVPADVEQDPEETVAPFTLLVERCERGCVVETGKLPFSEWGGILKDPMTSAAAMSRQNRKFRF